MATKRRLTRQRPRRRSAARTQGRLMLAALRQNLGLLSELATRYEVGRLTGDYRSKGTRPYVNNAEDAGVLLRPEMEGLAQEQLRVLLLDTQNRVTGHHLVYQGNVTSAVVRPAEVFREALLANAPRIIVAHNHPSGDPEPSPEDAETTGVLLRTADLLGIEVLDHLVIGHGAVVSLRSRGLPVGVSWPD